VQRLVWGFIVEGQGESKGASPVGWEEYGGEFCVGGLWVCCMGNGQTSRGEASKKRGKKKETLQSPLLYGFGEGGLLKSGRQQSSLVEKISTTGYELKGVIGNR